MVLDFILKFYGSIFQKLEECLVEGGGSNRIIIRSIHVPDIIDWLSNSPDLNSIENLWSIVKCNVEKCMPQNIDELKQFMAEEWNKIPDKSSSFKLSNKYDITQNISFIYEEPINGLKLYTTLVTVDYLMIWMAFEDEDPECMLPYFHLRIINKITGQTNYIDLNYTLPVEAVYPININLLPLTDNYMMLFYDKTTNGIMD
ncbi:hypothetical protein RhiirA4_549895 [Rhizophagus irregularis]|uniref:Uncharacterized protein n=2 Tax=Rhizophagus irregularis TaxID=588596 RepID=A0A2I1HGR1_9GLOM|nr:hypothetical protein RhiirA4_549895 [Rhizophagus irregularis]